MLSIALCLSQEHEVFILWDDKEIVQKALDRFGLDLTRVKVAVNVFDRSVNIIERLRKVNKYDLVIVLSDGSIPLFWEKKAVLHFQQPFKHVEGTSFINQMKLKRVVSIICNSNYTKRFIDGEFNVTSKVLYPPVDIESFKSNGIKKKLIVTVGRIQPVKKHEVLIDAFYRFKAKIPGWKMIVAGGLMDQDRKYYEYLEKKKGADVTIIPNVPFIQIKKNYKE